MRAILITDTRRRALTDLCTARAGEISCPRRSVILEQMPRRIQSADMLFIDSEELEVLLGAICDHSELASLHDELAVDFRENRA